ncbi:MAG: hypothetical protein K6F83_01280 [Clostridiales bacterium]|nr:hypothetical protein [Clostridiales bacterium]
MAEVDKKLSEYTTAASGSLTGNALELVAVEDENSDTGYSSRKVTSINKAQEYLNSFLFPLLLTTTSKSIIGAINELKAGGGAILTGTTTPPTDQGSNGNLYVRYTAGTGGASDVVNAMYVKLDDEWCEISTGGGETVLADILEAGQTSLTFSNATITSGAIIDICTSVFGVMPTGVSASTGSLTLTFTAQANDLGVKVVIN